MPCMTLKGMLTFRCRYVQLAQRSYVLVQRGANRLGIRAHTCWSCVGKYYASNFVWTIRHHYDSFNDRSLKHELHVFALPDPNSGVMY